MALGGRKTGVGWSSGKFSVLRRREAKSRREAEEDMSNATLHGIIQIQKDEIMRLKRRIAQLEKERNDGHESIV